ncbi:uncharacterized protein LOC143035937 [Oratosquilla oratoria]|uniref:uncharacterized protein LOC143035937 n=1 Tax=Oratosquilla oratoria TaxID=337810 RepID=UPI003F765D5F
MSNKSVCLHGTTQEGTSHLTSHQFKMHCSSVVLACALVAVVAANPAPAPKPGLPTPSHSCRYWCPTPENQFYCCEGDNKPISRLEVKHGKCPPVRPECPFSTRFGPPLSCSSDGSCPGIEKCCFDRCLKEHVCKGPEFDIGHDHDHDRGQGQGNAHGHDHGHGHNHK